MNDEPRRVTRGLHVAAVSEPTPAADEAGPDHEPPALRLEDLPQTDLRGKDLSNVEGLLPEHLAGRDLTRAKLPEHIVKFEGLRQVAEISADARKIFIGLLAACVYTWLVIGTTRDVELILNTASSPLPIINTPIPIAGFYWVGAALLAAVYCYLHFYLQRLWRTLAALPAVFPDGTALDDKTDPWLLTGLVRAYFKGLRLTARPLARLENLLSIVLAWGLVPLTLFLLWARYLPRHDWLGTAWLVLLIGATMLFGRHTFRLAKATLSGEVVSGADTEGADARRGVLGRAAHETRRLHPDKLTVSLTLILAICSISAFRDNPRDDYTRVAQLLNAVGIRTYADLREVDVAERPERWTGEEWDSVRRVDLRDRNLAFADATGAFLVNADLRGATLTRALLEDAQLQGADLQWAQLQGADLQWAQLQGAYLAGAQLQGAVLKGAGLQGADLRWAQLQGADLQWAQRQGADLRWAQRQDAVLRGAGLEIVVIPVAQLQGAVLTGAQLQGAVLTLAQLQGADLGSAQLQGADLGSAQLKGAYLAGAQLQGADLRSAQLQGADMRGASLWRALVSNASWNLADLSGFDIESMTSPAIDTLVSGATEGIANEDHREAVVRRLNAALRAADRPGLPGFPDEWQSEPGVMFEPGDPEPEPFDWGPLKWPSREAYDDELGSFFGELACAPNAPETQARGLAWRALRSSDRVFARRLASRLVGADCPPANGLPDDTRRQLEQLATLNDTVAVAPETSPADPGE